MSQNSLCEVAIHKWGPTGQSKVERATQSINVRSTIHRVTVDRLFRREGDDIHITLPITLDEAVLGAKIATPTIAGSVNLTIPKGASSGQTLRLRGRGVKPAGAAVAGDQKVELSIVSPPEVDDDLTKFMQKWRKTHDYDPRKGMAS